MLELAEELSISGFYDTTQSEWVSGSSLLPLGTAHRLPRPKPLAEDTEMSGRGLPPSFAPMPADIEKLAEYKETHKHLTVDVARKAFRKGDHLRLPLDERVVITMLWIRRLLLGSCPAKDQRIMLKLFGWNSELIAWTVWAYGIKLLFMRFHGNESIRLMRLLRDVGYLMMMTLEDRQRLLYFLLRQRITPATQASQ